VGLILMRVPIVNVLYERGAFTPETTAMTAAALAAFASGLPAYVLIKVFQPAYFARLDMKTPMWFSVVAVVVNIVGSLAMFPFIGHVGIALATSVSAWVNFALLAATLWRRDDFRPSTTTLRRVLMIVVASAAMGAVLWGLQIVLADWIASTAFLLRLLGVGLAIAAAAAFYFALAIVTGAIDRDQLMRVVRRRRAA
jgi:putative peptidoglycan lipid II flippase